MSVFVYDYPHRGTTHERNVDDVLGVVKAMRDLAMAQDGAIQFVCEGSSWNITKGWGDLELADIANKIVDRRESFTA